MKIPKEQAPELLNDIVGMGSNGSAESEPDDGFVRRFLPLREHGRALDPQVALIIGDRGAGKTELFRAIQFPAGLKAIQELASDGSIPSPAESQWTIGYSSTGAQFPAELAFREFSRGKQPADLQLIWLGLLLRSLPKFVEKLPVSLQSILTANPLRLENLFAGIREHLEDCFGALDTMDAYLLQSSRWIFITYDELDRVGAGDWAELQTILRGLVQFWSSYARRWKRVRPKIFLRRDLFNRVALFGPDVSKIAAQRVELVWTPRNLYALLAKRLINRSELLRGYFDPAMPDGQEREDLGWYPAAKKDEDYRKFVERICGRFMGATATKGQSFTWIINHLQDGNGQVLPRSMVRLFEKAAEFEISNRKAAWPQLLHHTSMRAAVDQVSSSRVQEIEDEEFPWMKTVRELLQKAHPRVPMERGELERLLNIDWSGMKDKPPESSGHSLLQFLMELGIFYQRGDRRVDARDLYMHGFGLKRTGGIARPH